MSDEGLVWPRDGDGWPNASASRIVKAGGLRWHVQVMGQGPVALLLHGTGASTHSWRGLAPILAEAFTLVMPDLPGHGFTSQPSAADMALPQMARALGALMTELGLEPELAIGHSAGAAIAAQMQLDGHLAVRHIIGLNAALQPFTGLAGIVFSPLARLMAGNPLALRLLAWRAEDRGRVASTLAGTGSKLDDAGIDLYHRLFASRRHVASALQMMAAWDLPALWPLLPKLGPRLVLIVASDDRAVPPEQGFAVRDHVLGTRVVYMRDVGHLAHEERPADVAELILAEWGKRIGERDG